ncbi:MAG: ABC-type transport system involved in resistance to organic solvent, permease component [Mycobacterium sp.]|nr:ABC-type transport system involved in resistance to organic solvent, permease component [Mycobacterium sp.]
MSTSTVLRSRFPRAVARGEKFVGSPVRFLDSVGHIAWFVVTAVGSIGHAFRYYRKEMLRLIAEIGMGTGAMAVIGGTVAIVGFVTLSGGSLIAIQGFASLGNIGVEAFTGFFAALVNVRIAAPVQAGIALASTVGAGATAELGAMRISEEIDALEVMGFDSMSYLVGTRLVAITIYTPFMFVAGSGIMYYVNYLLNVEVYQSVSKGGYLDVFFSFLTQQDVLLSLLAGAVMGVLIVLVGCYYGYNASGGPVGVGRNTAKSMIINLIIVSVVGAIFQQLFFGGFARSPIGN